MAKRPERSVEEGVVFGEPPAHAARRRSKAEDRLHRDLLKSDFVYDVEVAYGSISHLTRVGGRPTLGNYIRELWHRRHFIWRESRSKVATQNAGNRLGSAWLILRPLLDALFYWLIFGLILKIGRGLPNYVAFVIIGVFMFQLSRTAMNSGTTAIRQSKAMIRAFSFPRASIPLSIILRNSLERIPATLVMFVIIILVPPHVNVTVVWLLFPVIVLVQTVFDIGLTLLFARLGAAVPDFAQALPFVSRLLMYGSGVIFPIDRFVNHPTAMFIIELNPIYQFLDAYRTVLIGGTVPGPLVWVQIGAWAIGTLIVGFVLFWLGEESYAKER